MITKRVPFELPLTFCLEQRFQPRRSMRMTFPGVLLSRKGRVHRLGNLRL